MSAHIEKIRTHAVYTSIAGVNDEISLVKNMEDISEDVLEEIARIASIVENFTSAVESCPSNFVAITWLNEASSACTNTKTYLANFRSNRNLSTLLSNATPQLDVILRNTVNLNCVKSSQTLRGANATTEKFIRTIGDYNKKLEDKVNQLQDRITEKENEIDNNAEKATSILSELKSSIDSEKQRLDTFALSYQSQMTEDQKEFSNMCSMLRETFVSSQDERKKVFEEEVKANSEARNEFQETSSSEIEKMQLRSQEVIRDYSDKFSDYEKQVENIVGIVNTNMFSHKYKEVADDAHKRARFWHAIAVILMVLVSGFAVYAFVLTTNQDTSWVRLVAKIFATTTLVTGSAYSARQASKQEKVERYARKIEMELVAIDPFIESLDEDRRSSIKEEIARKIFGNSDGMEINTKDEPYTAVDKLASIEDLLAHIIKKLPK